MLVRPQAASVDRRLLATAIPPCIVPIPRACASSHPYAPNTCCDPSFYFLCTLLRSPCQTHTELK
ncbi:hypothetical protein EXN66_Car007282 [Channa argus]|uniref:Uncharacterized protein n=1 Tax=Channa argus TaxID=215402 RepID=A0A6G1PN14_CHAAH|nr:hypothetical protein EXN66_Car007282 [Channa argus]